MDNKSPLRIVTTTFGRLVIVSDDGGVVVWEKSRAVVAAGRHDSSDKYTTATLFPNVVILLRANFSYVHCADSTLQPPVRVKRFLTEVGLTSLVSYMKLNSPQTSLQLNNNIQSSSIIYIHYSTISHEGKPIHISPI